MKTSRLHEKRTLITLITLIKRMGTDLKEDFTRARLHDKEHVDDVLIMEEEHR